MKICNYGRYIQSTIKYKTKVKLSFYNYNEHGRKIKINPFDIFGHSLIMNQLVLILLYLKKLSIPIFLPTRYHNQKFQCIIQLLN